ncbi:3'-5' exonuclease [Nitrosophilus alvini]|uniref:3'-5' exonuclease n=1 Tax=Nitrosophilus alvini TaxID=2714855 RepID=UPI00190A1481|nr:3'-5' exonuclease [Nitrosophilus alvini]
MICVFDCETIPDIDLLRQNFDVKDIEEDFLATQKAVADYEAKSGTTFLPLPFHKVVAISAVIADDFGKFKKVSSIEGENEKEMIENFLRFIDRHNPKLVSFNGRSFDIPMLLLRALKYNLSCPSYFETDNQILNKTKWENYRQRYSEQFHTDLMEVLGHFGAVRGLKLDLVCQMAGIPGKFDISGDQVAELYYRGEFRKIKEYCESDVLNTYWLYLKYELLKGNISYEDYVSYLGEMFDKIPQGKSYSRVFKDEIEQIVYQKGNNGS